MSSPPIYAELGHFVPSGLSQDIERKVKEIIADAIAVLGIKTGAVNMDIIINSQENIYIVDVGVRMGGNLIGSHIIPYSTGFDYIGSLIKLSMGESIYMSNKLNQDKVVTRLITLTPGIVEAIGDVSILESKNKVEIYHNINSGQIINSYRNNTDGLGYIISRSKNADNDEIVENVLKLLDSIVTKY